MKLTPSISQCTQRIIRRFKPQKIVLFGSHARGESNADSDVDLLVVLSHADSAVRKASEIRLALPSDMAIDVLVRTPEQIRHRLKLNDFFIRDIIEKGRVLYDAGNARVG